MMLLIPKDLDKKLKENKILINGVAKGGMRT